MMTRGMKDGGREEGGRKGPTTQFECDLPWEPPLISMFQSHMPLFLSIVSRCAASPLLPGILSIVSIFSFCLPTLFPCKEHTNGL